VHWHSRWYRLREDPRIAHPEPLREASGTRWGDDRDSPLTVAALVMGIGIPASVVLAFVAVLLMEVSAEVRIAIAIVAVLTTIVAVLRAREARARWARRASAREARAAALDERPHRLP